MGRRGVGGHGTSAHGVPGQPPGREPGLRTSAERPYPAYGGGNAAAPAGVGGPAAQRGAVTQQDSWETPDSSGQSFRTAQPSTNQPPSSPPPPPSRQRSRQSSKKPGRGATYSVVVMTIASLFGVAVLAAQAAATAPQVSNAKNAGKATAQPSANASAGSSPAGAAGPSALPANSGSGQRIVYGETAKRVWLVGSGESVVRTFAIVPGTVAAPTGTFAVTNRLSAVTGTDGTPVQYVVLFDKAKVEGSSTAFGFDAVANVTGMPPPPNSRTGGVRMAQADAQALWNFSSLGTKVVVVP